MLIVEMLKKRDMPDLYQIRENKKNFISDRQYKKAQMLIQIKNKSEEKSMNNEILKISIRSIGKEDMSKLNLEVFNNGCRQRSQ